MQNVSWSDQTTKCFAAIVIAVRGVHESTYELAELKWNEQNPVPVTPPEDFEARFAKSLESISDDCLCVTSGKFLRQFEAHFGFDLKEVVREQWAKENRNAD